MTGAAAAATDAARHGSLARVAADPGVRALVRSPLFWARPRPEARRRAPSLGVGVPGDDLSRRSSITSSRAALRTRGTTSPPSARLRQFPYRPVMLDCARGAAALFGPHLSRTACRSSRRCRRRDAAGVVVPTAGPRRVARVLVFAARLLHPVPARPTRPAADGRCRWRASTSWPRRQVGVRGPVGLALATRRPGGSRCRSWPCICTRGFGWAGGRRARFAGRPRRPRCAVAVPAERGVPADGLRLRDSSASWPPYPARPRRAGPLLAPVALVLLWLRFASYPKVNWDSVQSRTWGLVFGVFVLLAPPRPGYVLWSLPFIAYYCCRQNEARFVALHVYTLAYFAYFWTGPESDLFDAWTLVAPRTYNRRRGPAGRFGADAAANSATSCSRPCSPAMAAVLVPMYLNGVPLEPRLPDGRNLADARRPGRRQRAGKDIGLRTLARRAGRGPDAGDFGRRLPPSAVTADAMWQVHTHLDVRANDLMKAERRGRHRPGPGRAEGHLRPRDRPVHERSVGGPADVRDLRRPAHAGPRIAAPPVRADGVHRPGRVAPARLEGAARPPRPRLYGRAGVGEDRRLREADRTKYILPQADEAELTIRFRPGGAARPAGRCRRAAAVLELVASNRGCSPTPTRRTRRPPPRQCARSRKNSSS